jgi:hypothetical protein
MSRAVAGKRRWFNSDLERPRISRPIIGMSVHGQRHVSVLRGVRIAAVRRRLVTARISRSGRLVAAVPEDGRSCHQHRAGGRGVGTTHPATPRAMSTFPAG